MLYYDFNAGNKAYKLRINTRNVIQLEKALGCNPLGIFGDGEEMPTVEKMVAVLHASLQQYQHNMGINEAYEVFDDYLADGNNITDFVSVILSIYEVSGLIPKVESINTEKN